MQRVAVFLLLLFISVVLHSQALPNKIPIDPKRWHQLNNCSCGLDDLFDGYLFANGNTGYGKMFSNF